MAWRFSRIRTSHETLEDDCDFTSTINNCLSGGLESRLTISIGQWVTLQVQLSVFFLLLSTLGIRRLVMPTVIGGNSQALLLILGKFSPGEQLVFFGDSGVVLAFGGCSFSTRATW
jgi:hypothetical protein